MVKIIALAVIATAVLLLVACGADSDSSNSDSGQSAATRPPARPASGPSATADPARGRPGTEVVISGAGWMPGSTITIAGATGGSSGQPYASATATNEGSFTARFRLDRGPVGGDLPPGRVNLVAASGSLLVMVPFDVLPPAPGGPGSPGG
ncbi:MAG: hypothetical protein GEU75_07875 [Dehalococcoidia bacterium]|nr:hypothetical protein [Dehalococcoidia bacterium]